MKKLLAMVLALVMTLSLAVSANAFKDDKSISDDYAEAVAVLNSMGVFKGYEDGSFKPEGKVTGYEVLAMILRAVGYDKNNEFSGTDWALHVAQTAHQAGLLKNVKGVDLNAAASRELVAELLFRGIQASTVTYTPAFGYVTDKVIGAATSYGVINSIWWVGNTADGSGVAKANVTYVDGTTAVLDISTLIYNGAAAENRNTTYTAKGGKLSHNTAALKVMSGDTYSTAPTSYFYIDDYIDQNARADKTGAQILNDDMFQFSTQTDGTVKAVEVSGAGTAAAYKNLHSENLAIYKDTQITSGLVANSNTVYLIRSGDDTTASPYTFKSVTGFDKIDRYQNDEVDYVMSDDFAKYVFIKADPTESKVTSVFFYAGEQASFNNETGVWTTPGYLDGEKTVIYAVGWNNSNVNTIIDTATGRGNANTIYSVALSNGYLDKDYTSAWVYTSTDPIRAASVNGVTYPLAAAYMNRNDVKVLTIQGSSSDTFEGNVYTHNDAKYSVVSNADFASKINSEFTNLGDKVIYLAYISGSGEYSGSILHANIVDRATTADELREISAVKPNGTVTAASSQSFKDITISNWDVTYTDGLTSGSTATVKTVNIEWYKLNEAGTEYNVKVVDTNAPFIAGNSCKFVATVELTGSNADDFTFADGANVYTGYVNNVQ